MSSVTASKPKSNNKTTKGWKQCNGMAVALASSRTKDKKGMQAELKKRECKPKQCPAQKRNGM